MAISEVDIVAAKKQTQGGYSIPIREIATSMQTFETKELKGFRFQVLMSFARKNSGAWI